MPAPNDLSGERVNFALPTDPNFKPLSALILPLVDGSGEITGYAPLAYSDNGDGTVSLKVDTELSVGADFNLETVGGVTQTGADWTPLFQHLDVDLSTLATEATLSTLLTEADFDSKVALLATEATLATLLTEADFDSKVALLATEATLATLLTEATFTARINTLGQKTSANSTPVVIASDQSPVTVYPQHGTKTTTSVSVTTAATLILTANSNRKVAKLLNNGVKTVYLDKTSGVSVATGYPLVPGAELTDESSTDAWYGITSSGSSDVRTLEMA